MALSMLQDAAPQNGLGAVASHLCRMKEDRPGENNNMGGLLSPGFPASLLGPLALHASIASNPALLRSLGWEGKTTREPSPRPREKSFVCRICNNSFGYKHVLQNHERTHTGEKPFECSQCHKRFTRDHHLKTHMRLHTGEKPYHCPHCDRHFVQVANLRRHLRVHTGERPYACEVCSSRFSDSNQLKSHVLIHKGMKPFECGCCGGRFRRRHHLVHHKCRSPPEQTEPEDLSMSKSHNNNDSEEEEPWSKPPRS